MVDYEQIRKALSSRSDARTEQVTVNQRHLIDKILARYSAEFTVYREVLQNSNDAGASCLEIHFGTEKHHQNRKKAQTLTLRNNGRPFSPADWARLKSIAEGNPDEQKIGFFGVGFYSIFSICEEPMVISGGECLSFYWERDQLFTRMAQVTDSDDGWTTIYLSLREPMDLPSLDVFAQFLAKSLLFTVALAEIKVSINESLMFQLSRQTSDEQLLNNSIVINQSTIPSGAFTISKVSMSTVQLLLDKRYSSEPESKGFFEDVWRLARESLSKDSKLYETIRKPGKFHLFARVFSCSCTVSLQSKVAAELERITKKRPARSFTISALYSSYAEHSASDSLETVKHPVLHGVLPSIHTHHTPTGYVFIGFETHQSSGVAVHISGPFIPTVERESIDFVDSAVRVWNEECIGASGLLLRAIWDHEVTGLEGPLYKAASDHLIRAFPFSRTSPLSVVGEILKRHFLLVKPNSLLVPSSVGVRRVNELRIVPKDMRSFLINTPQPFSSEVLDFNFLLSTISGVKEADIDDIIIELKGRPFQDDETIAAIKWSILRVSRGPSVPPATGRALLDLLTVPVGDANKLKPLSSLKYYHHFRRINWPIPEDCASRTFSESLSHDEWEALRIKPLPIPVWLQYVISKGLDFSICEDILVTLGTVTINDIDRATAISLLSNIPCIPTSTGKLMLPKEVFLEDAVSFGLNLPTVHINRRALVSDSTLKSLGVRSHLPANELFQFIESADWDARRLIKYLAGIQDDLSTDEFERVRMARIFPDQSGKLKLRICDLSRDSRAARILNLPVFNQADLGDEQQVRLLRRLGFHFFVQFTELLAGIQSERPIEDKSILYEYLFEHFEFFKEFINQGTRIVLCIDKSIHTSSECFIDPRSAILGFNVVHRSIAGPAELYLLVKRRPAGIEILDVLKTLPGTEFTGNLLSFLSACEWNDEDIVRLSNVPFIKGADGKLTTPKQSFFKVPPDFVSIFSPIDPALYQDAAGVRQFLRSCGAQEEPSADDLMFACARSPEVLLKSLGTKKYAALLRLFSVHLDSISASAISTLARSKALLGVYHDSQEASLFGVDSVYIGDDAISQRQFGIPVAPLDLESFYEHLGCRRVSHCITSDSMMEGPTEANHPRAIEIRDLVKDRARVIVYEALKDKLEDESGAFNSLTGLKFAVVQKLMISKRFGSNTKSFPATASYHKTSHFLYITDAPDPFDVAGCLVEALSRYFTSSRSSVLSDTLLISTLLSMPVESLRKRGFLGASDGGKDIEESLEELSINIPKQPETVVSAQPEDQAPTHPPVHVKPEPTQVPSKPKTLERKPKFFEKIMSVLGIAKDTHEPRNIKDILGEGVKASRANQGGIIYREQDKKVPPPIHDPLSGNIEGECAIAHDLVRIAKVSGFEFYTIPELTKSPVPQPAISLAGNILAPLSAIFSIHPRSMHIFHDPNSRSIAFNRGGALFFNALYMIPRERPLVFWYMTACHELAHNFSNGHDMQHEHYMMAYAEQYIDKLLPYL